MTENSTRPISEKITRPLPTVVVHCTLTVSGRFNRSLGSAALQAIIATDERTGCEIRIASPRFRPVDQYHPPGMVSVWMIVAASIGGAGSTLGSGNAFGANSRPLRW